MPVLIFNYSNEVKVNNTGRILTFTWPHDDIKEYRLWKFTLKTDPLLTDKFLVTAVHTHGLKNTQNLFISSLTVIVQSLKLEEIMPMKSPEKPDLLS